MKDDDLKEAMGDLEKEAREFCKEKDLDPEETKFTLRIFKNFTRICEVERIEGIDKLIGISREEIEYFGKSEAMMFFIDDEPGLSPEERILGESWISYAEEKRRSKN
ncbi:MAG: hypothetical protein GQ545_10550, partial [Candidatus Aminicenantes bacterium]|nr:hypothetical protein [Candidatus Aminicenantes bacterium]